MEKFKRYASGRHTPKEIRWHLAVLIFVFWGLILCAWLGYTAEHPYSIKSNTLSALGSFDSRHNPEWFWIFSIAMVYCGVVTTPVVLYIRRRLGVISGVSASVGAFFFLAGCLGIVLAGAFPYSRSELLPGWTWRELHMRFAVLIAIGFSLGIFWHAGLLIKDKCADKRLSSSLKRPYLRYLAPFMVCVPIFVMVGYRIEWAYLYDALKSLVAASGREMGGSFQDAFSKLRHFPQLEHVSIWALTVFVVWFTMSLPDDVERVEQHETEPPTPVE